MFNETSLIGFAPHLRLQLELGDCLVKTAESREEVEQALRMRYDVFYRERLGSTDPHGLDIDRFDRLCDHMLAVETRTGRVIGTYRLNPSPDNNCFASQEFDISSILRLEGRKLEIGRACVARSGRARGVFMMLWAGIAEYMGRTGTRYLFGCASLPPGESPRRVARLYDYLRSRHYSTDDRRVYSLKPLPECAALEHDPSEGESMDEVTGRRLLPLLWVYLHAGAVVCGEPSYDETLHTYDFFTLLDLEALTTAGHKLFRTPNHGPFNTVSAFMKA